LRVHLLLSYNESKLTKAKGGEVHRVVTVAITIGISCVVFFLIGCGGQQPPDADLASASRHVCGEFMDEVKAELYAALDSGVVEAVAICSERAPAISARYSGLPGWTVKRVSAKFRNPDNAPDDYEAEALEILENRPATAGDEYFSWVDENGVRKFHFMKAIKVKAPCLNCHGDKRDFSPELIQVLQERYPEDHATGFGLDENRGALSVTIDWPEGQAVFDSISAAM
jgi:hypothetical protein